MELLYDIQLTSAKAASTSSYLAEISKLFVASTRRLPRMSDLGALYPNSKRLQYAICEYTILVVGLCKEIVQFVKKNPFRQAASITFKQYNNSVFTEYQTDLEEQMQTIQDEASCSNNEIVSKIHDAQTQSIERRKKHSERKARERFLHLCSSYDYCIDLQQAKDKGTVTWVFEHEAYISWKTSGGLLWCSGILASGKTVLTASMIHELMGSIVDATVAYFFCRYDKAESLHAEAAIRSIARQILQTIPMDFEKASIDRNYSEVDQIVVLLQNLPKAPRKYYILVDGLDDCDEAEIQALLRFLTLLVKSNKSFNIFCSSRPEITLRVPKVLRINYLIKMSDSNTAIEDYISDTLQECVDSGRLLFHQPTLIAEIVETLLTKAGGMSVPYNQAEL